MNTNINIAQPVFSQEAFETVSASISSINWIKHSAKRTNALIELYEASNPISAWPLIVHLIKEFKYVGDDLFSEAKQDIAEQIVNWIKAEDITYVVAISDKKDADGSQALLQFLKNAEPFDGFLNEEQFINSITGGIQSVAEAQLEKNESYIHVVLIDDFIGTGKTIQRKLKWFNKTLSEMGIRSKVRINLCSLACMNNATSAVEELKGLKFLDEFFCPILIKKGISDFFNEPQLSQNIALMKTLEST